jgi:hypothetical protein
MIRFQKKIILPRVYSWWQWVKEEKGKMGSIFDNLKDLHDENSM